MSQKKQQVDIALQKVLKNLITQIQQNGQLQEHHRKVSEAKIYDRLEKKYIEKERLKHQFGEDYESSGSDSDNQNQYKGLDKDQLKYLIRKKLINKKFCENYLQEINLCPQNKEQVDCAASQQQDSSLQINQIPQTIDDGLKIINQANQIFMEDIKQDKNLFALKFIIQGLQQIANAS